MADGLHSSGKTALFCGTDFNKWLVPINVIASTKVEFGASSKFMLYGEKKEIFLPSLLFIL
jgi:hypothetical protein